LPDKLLVVLRVRTVRDRSAGSVVQSVLNIKQWQQRKPGVAEVRPGWCPACAAASCPLGGGIRLQGHGVRDRQVAGPAAPDAAPELVTVSARRYRCVLCEAVIIVVPSEMHGRRVYSLSAIALALALWGLVRATAATVRVRVSPASKVGYTAARGWATLRRWARDVALGRLFPGTPLVVQPPLPVSLRRIAAGAASALAASADPTTRELPIEHRAFLGAAHAA
jgi:hypothetical protein